MTDQITGTLRAFEPELVFENPFQHPGARRTGGPEFDQFVEDVRANGVRTPPPARPHPDVSGGVQLREGHRRLAAHKLAFPGQPFVVLMQQISDEDMLDDCIRENVFRADWNDIEIAEMMETYLRVHPNATNAELARKFNYKNPASIPNVRKLLRLPQGIQAHVISNALPDAIARALVGVSAVNPKAAQKIADAVADAPKSEKQDTFENLARDLYWRSMVSLDNVWSLDWLEDAPVTVERDLGDGEHVITACAGCVFNVNEHCARKPCYEEKHKLWSAAEAQRVAASKQLAVAGPDEKTFKLFDGNYGDDDRAQDLLNARKEIRALLRVAPLGGSNHNYLSRLLGSRAVTLVTTDKSAINNFFEERSAAAKSKLGNAQRLSADKEQESDAERAKRIERERKEMDAKRAARSTMWKSYYDAKWLLESAARHIGEELANSFWGNFVMFVEAEFCNRYTAYGAANDMDAQLKKEIQTRPTDDGLRLARVVLHILASTTHDGAYRIAENKHEYMFPSVRNQIQAYCSQAGARFYFAGHPENVSLGVELPAGWDIPPIHKTEINCWHCGVFAGNMSEKLTRRDMDGNGWIDDGGQGVFCSQEHKGAYLAAQSDGEHHAETKTKAKAKARRATSSKSNKAQRTKRK